MSRHNWARAHRLAELSGIPINGARSALAQVRENDDYEVIIEALDSGADASDPALGQLIDTVQTVWASQGAAAAAQRNNPAFMSIINWVDTPNARADVNGPINDEEDATVLWDLKPVIEQWGLDLVEKGVAEFRFLQDTPL